MIKQPLLFVTCIILAVCCYINYQGWDQCQKNKERIADDLYKLQKECEVKSKEFIDAKVDVLILRNQLEKRAK